MESTTQRVVYPLNSKRISLAQLRQLAQALDIPVAASMADLKVMVEEKPRELERDPVNVQMVVKEIPDGSQSLELQDESGTFLEATALTCSKASTPVDVLGSHSSLSSLQGSALDASVGDGLLDKNLPESQEVLHSADTEVSLKQLTEEQRLTIEKYKHELFNTEERLAELSAMNQQLTSSLGDIEKRVSELVIENELLKHQLAVSPNVENLKQELQQGQSRIKELWSKSCNQV